MAYIKEETTTEYNPRELSFISLVNDEVLLDFDGEINFETVDTVVLTHIDSIESVNIDNNLLKTIYLGLDDVNS